MSRRTLVSCSRAVYPEHNLSSILTLSMPKWQVPTQEQNDPTDDASATRSTRGNRGTSYPWPWLNQNNTDNVSSDCDSQFLVIISIIIISSTHSTCGLLCGYYALCLFRDVYQQFRRLLGPHSQNNWSAGNLKHDVFGLEAGSLCCYLHS